MSLFIKIVALTGLGFTIIPSLLVFTDRISFEMHTNLMIAGMILWFVASPFWMKEKEL
jgi:hypothetical protein